MDCSGHPALCPSGAAPLARRVQNRSLRSCRTMHSNRWGKSTSSNDLANYNWWREVDSNHRRRKPADLQSAPVGRLGIPPNLLSYLFAGSAGRWIPRAGYRVRFPAPTRKTRRCSTTPGFRRFASQRLRIFAANGSQVNHPGPNGTRRPRPVHACRPGIHESAQDAGRGPQSQR